MHRTSCHRSQRDLKTGNYNILLELQQAIPESFEDYVKEILLDTAACCCEGTI